MLIYNYITTNIINGKQYVGMHASDDIENDQYLGSGHAILRAIKKYGRENFKRDILCVSENKEIAHKNEKKLIKEHNTLNPNGYNLSPTGGLGVGGSHSKESLKKMSENRKGIKAWNEGIKHSEEAIDKMKAAKAKYKPWLGRKHTEEQKRKIGEANSKRIVTDETKQKLREINLGRKQSEETKKKIGESLKGRVFSEEHRRKIGEANKRRKYKKLSDERKRQISEDLKKRKGEKRSEEAKRNMSKAQQGKTVSDETKKKISETLKGRVFSEEHRKKISEANKRRHARNKEKNVDLL